MKEEYTETAVAVSVDSEEASRSVNVSISYRKAPYRCPLPLSNNTDLVLTV